MAAAFGGGAASATSIRAASSCSSNAALPTRRTGRPAGSRCSIASGSNSHARLRRSRGVLLLDEVAGGLTEHECAALVDLIRSIHRSGVSIIWIEHVVHALIAVVDRLLVLHGGGFIARGRPEDRDHVGRRFAKSTWESPPMPEPLLDVRALDAFYGDFQALFGVSMRVAAGRGGRRDRRQWRREIDAAQLHRRRHAGRVVTRSCSTASRSATSLRMRWSARGIALVPEGRRLFASLTVEENLLIGGQLGRPGPWNLAARSTTFPGAGGATPACRARRCRAASSRWSPSAAR